MKTNIILGSDGTVHYYFLEGKESIVSIGRKVTTVIHDGSFAEPDEKVQIDVDTNLSSNGLCRIHASITSFDDAALRVELKVPDGWTLKKSPELIFNVPQALYFCRVYGYEELTWDIVPTSQVLPVFSQGCLDFKINCGSKTENIRKDFCLGSGYVTRWSVLGSFDNTAGIDEELQPEIDSTKPFYECGDKKLFWSELSDYDYNCMGYVDLRWDRVVELSNGRGTAYAKCRIWSPEDMAVYAEIGCEPAFKLWLNHQIIFKTNSIFLKQRMDTPVLLKMGWNTLLVKVCIDSRRPYSGREYGFNFRFIDANGQVINKLLLEP